MIGQYSGWQFPTAHDGDHMIETFFSLDQQRHDVAVNPAADLAQAQ